MTPSRALVLLALVAACGAAPCVAQTRLASLEELQRAIAAGDVVTLTASGDPMAGRVTRVGADDLAIRLSAPAAGTRDVSIPLSAIRSLERRRDPVRNGMLIGAGVGAGAGGALFISALAVDRNEIDEWAGAYAVATAALTGIGALLGWAIDAGRSKPHLRFDASPPGGTGGTVVSVAMPSRGAGIALTVSFHR